MPPKRVADSAEGTPQPDSLATIHSFADLPKPWKNPNYKKNTGRRTKTLKQVLAAEREKVFVKPEPKAPRPRGFQKKAVRESMAAERQAELESGQTTPAVRENVTTYFSVEAPPSLLPAKKYCDVTGLPALYTDPKSKLRYHSTEIYELIRSFPPSADQAYLGVRGASTQIV